MEATNSQKNFLVDRFSGDHLLNLSDGKNENPQKETQGLQRKEKLRPLQNYNTPKPQTQNFSATGESHQSM